MMMLMIVIQMARVELINIAGYFNDKEIGASNAVFSQMDLYQTNLKS